MKKKSKRKPPQRPPTPNTKGLIGMPTLFLKLRPDRIRDLQLRARYETLHWRVEHHGKGHVISSQDIARRLIDEFFENVSPLPADAIGNAIRSTLKKASLR